MDPVKTNDLATCRTVCAPPEGVTPSIEQIRESIDAFNQVVTEISEIVRPIAEMAYKCGKWACANRPRLVHLANRSKKARVRKKNTARILREFFKEVTP